MTLEEVGRYFGVTRERIRQIETRTLFKLKSACGGRGAFQPTDADGPGILRSADPR